MNSILIGAALMLRGLCLGSASAHAQTQIYKGTSNYSSDVFFTARDGKIYKGNSNYSSDVLANIDGNRLYKGNSNYSSDVLYSWDGLLTIDEFVAFWCLLFVY